MKIKHYPCTNCHLKYASVERGVCPKCASAASAMNPAPLNIPEYVATPMIAAATRVLARQYRQLADLHEQLANAYDQRAIELRGPLATLPAPQATAHEVQ